MTAQACQGTRYCGKTQGLRRCTRCGAWLCRDHQVQTTCGKAGHRLAVDEGVQEELARQPGARATRPKRRRIAAQGARTGPPTRSCEACGQSFPKTRATRCPACRQAALETKRTKTCADCGGPFPSRGRTTRCEACRERRPQPRTRTCRECGADFPVYKHALRCAPCREAMPERPRRRALVAKPPVPCVECGEPFRRRGRARRCSACAAKGKHPLRTCTCQRCEKEFRARCDAKFCPDCRFVGRPGRKPLYEWTEERLERLRERYDSRVRNRVKELADEFGFPRWAVKRKARELGLTHAVVDRREWTAEEDALLRAEAGRRTADWLAKRLGRGLTSVVVRLKRLRLSRRFRDGYTAHLLAECFGVDAHVVTRWVADGLLHAERRGTARATDPHVVEEAEVRRFVAEHRDAYRLDKVDQAWFLEVAFGPREELAEGPTMRCTVRGCWRLVAGEDMPDVRRALERHVENEHHLRGEAVRKATRRAPLVRAS